VNDDKDEVSEGADVFWIDELVDPY
jgi:hypothetical protein